MSLPPATDSERLMISLIQSARKTTLAVSLALCATVSHAALITFDTVVSGATSFGYDGDGDGINDVVFSTTDTFGFNTVGPGTNMSYINEPGIEGTTSLAPDLRVNFLRGAIGTLGFGFAMNASVGGSPISMTFSIFNSLGNLLGTSTIAADFTDPPGPSPGSSYPEALVSLAFAGEASYATFDFNSTVASRYIVDNFSGSTERDYS